MLSQLFWTKKHKKINIFVVLFIPFWLEIDRWLYGVNNMSRISTFYIIVNWTAKKNMLNVLWLVHWCSHWSDNTIVLCNGCKILKTISQYQFNEIVFYLHIIWATIIIIILHPQPYRMKSACRWQLNCAKISTSFKRVIAITVTYKWAFQQIDQV